MTEEEQIKNQVAEWQRKNPKFILKELTSVHRGVYGWGFNLLEGKPYFRVTSSGVENLGGYIGYEDNYMLENKIVTKHNFNNTPPTFMYEFNNGSTAKTFTPDVQKYDIDKYLYVKESNLNGGSRKRRRNNKMKIKYSSKGGSKKRQQKKSYKNR